MRTDDPLGRAALLSARGEIMQILRRHNLCGSIVLAGEHQMEALLDLDATWSRASLVTFGEGGQGIHIRSTSQDYGGDIEAQKRDLEATISMIRGMLEILGFTAFAMHKCDEEISKLIDSVSGPLVHIKKQ